MSISNKNRVFLSYAKEDLDIVWKVYDGMKKRGLDVWFDKKDLKPGSWKPQIEKAINRSRFFVICISEAALRKTGDEETGFQDEELNKAYNIAEKVSDNTFTIVPVRLADCDRGDTRLSIFQQYDLFNDFEKELDDLAVDLGGHSLSDVNAVDRRTELEKTISHLMNRAYAASYAGEYDKSITILDSVLALDTNNDKAWNDKGAFLGKLGRYVEAIENFEQAIKIAPDDHLAWNNKGTALYRLNRNEEAVKAYDQSIKHKSDFYQAYNNKGIALGNLDRHKEAIDVYDQAINITPDHPFAWYNKGVALVFLDRHDEAIEAYDQAIKYKHDYYEAWYNKGNSLVSLGRIEEAVEAFDQAIRYKHDYYNAWYNKGVTLDSLDRHKEAKKAFDQANKYKPNNQNT
jgi:tetratricopeptide (TPR) repeat protein